MGPNEKSGNFFRIQQVFSDYAMVDFMPPR